MTALPKIDIGQLAIHSLSAWFESDGVDVNLMVAITVNSSDGSARRIHLRRSAKHHVEMFDRYPAHAIVEHELRDVLCHELSEWLRLDGVLVRNPHPELGARDTWLDRAQSERE